MDNALLGEQIAKYRKEQGITQEGLGKAVGVTTQAVSRWENGGAPDVALLPAIADTLGVTIDALFGREGGERFDIHDAAARWIKGIPKGERLDQLCRLVWHLYTVGAINDFFDLPKLDYPKHAASESLSEDKLLLMRCLDANGIILDVHADDMSFVTIWPKPKKGYEAYFLPKDQYRALYRVLAKPGCLELLEYLYNKAGRYLVPEVVAERLHLPQRETEELLAEMDELQMLWSNQLELKTGVVTVYQISEPPDLIPFLYLSRCLMQQGYNLTGYVDNSELPLFQEGVWKASAEEKESGHEKK